MLRKLIQYAWAGIMIGATLYVFGELTQTLSMTPTVTNMAGLIAMSTLIGLWSFIFNYFQGPNAILLSLHALGSFGIVLLISLICGWYSLKLTELIPLIGYFIAFYVIVQLGLYLYSLLTVSRLNTQLKQRKYHQK